MHLNTRKYAIVKALSLSNAKTLLPLLPKIKMMLRQ